MSKQLKNSTPVFKLSKIFAIFPYQVQIYWCNFYYIHFWAVFIIISYWAFGICPVDFSNLNGLFIMSNILRMVRIVELYMFFGTAILCFVVSFFRNKIISDTMDLLNGIDIVIADRWKWEVWVATVLVFRYLTMLGLTLWWCFVANMIGWVTGAFICELYDMFTLLILSQYIVGLLVVNGMFKQINMDLKKLNDRVVTSANGSDVSQFLDSGKHNPFSILFHIFRFLQSTDDMHNAHSSLANVFFIGATKLFVLCNTCVGHINKNIAHIIIT